MSHTDEESSQPNGIAGTAFVAVAVSIFAIVSYTFLFPCNKIIPLDRRTIAVVGALLCYLTRTFFFNQMNMLKAIDFDVLVLLASIMVVNHVVVHLKETKKIIKYLQQLVKLNPKRGFWMIALASFLVSPFLTNDGVCLLFVEPILNAFDIDDSDENIKQNNTVDRVDSEPNILQSEDVIYFLLALACSANIGSQLTYTGNPQNMIVSTDSINVMPSYKFLLYMIIPASTAWFITIGWVYWCWCWNKQQLKYATEETIENALIGRDEESMKSPLVEEEKSVDPNNNSFESITTKKPTESLYLQLSMRDCVENSVLTNYSPLKSPKSPMSPRKKRKKEREVIIDKVVHVISSPFPYMVLILLAAMIIMIFVDVLPISALICVSSMCMVVTVVVGNHWRNKKVWQTETTVTTDDDKKEETEASLEKLTQEEKVENLNVFFEDLFNSIDYSLLLIFLGTFIVVENMASTGIPKFVWGKIVGEVPFQSVSSIIGICLFVLISSQLLGNVAVVQLAKPNVETLNDESKRFAWAIISFVATVGGNLTITGSAANIIVAEKARKLDPNLSIDFFLCFWITLLSCVVGSLLLTGIVYLDNLTGSNW